MTRASMLNRGTDKGPTRVSHASPSRMRRETGLTLLEVMVALAILAIALPVLIGLKNRDVELYHQARQQTMATLLAQEKLLETELMAFPPIGEQSGEFKSAPRGFPSSMVAQDRAPGFRWTRTILPTPLSSIREVRIRIFWPRGEAEEALELSSYVFREAPPRS